MFLFSNTNHHPTSKSIRGDKNFCTPNTIEPDDEYHEQQFTELNGDNQSKKVPSSNKRKKRLAATEVEQTTTTLSKKISIKSELQEEDATHQHHLYTNGTAPVYLSGQQEAYASARDPSLTEVGPACLFPVNNYHRPAEAADDKLLQHQHQEASSPDVNVNNNNNNNNNTGEYNQLR